MSSIIRTNPTHGFTPISNKVFADNQLSFGAIGLLTYILSKPPHWCVSTKHLVKVTEGTRRHSKESVVLDILRELREAGFVHWKKLSTGKSQYTVYDEPHLKNQGQATENRSKNEPHLKKPDVAFSGELVINDLIEKKELINTNNDFYNGNEKPEKARVTQLPTNFALTAEMIDWYKNKNFTVDIHVATERWKSSMIQNQRVSGNWVKMWQGGMTQWYGNGKSSSQEQDNQSPTVTSTAAQPDPVNTSATTARKKLRELYRDLSSAKAEVSFLEGRQLFDDAERYRLQQHAIEQEIERLSAELGVKSSSSSAPSEKTHAMASAIQSFAAAFRSN